MVIIKHSFHLEQIIRRKLLYAKIREMFLSRASRHRDFVKFSCHEIFMFHSILWNAKVSYVLYFTGLCQDVDRTWRLFRELIEGLVHIHEQGMIHRDLKPVNIFLDSNDHVKIGDFGLATSEILSKQGDVMDLTQNLSMSMDFKNTSSKSDSLDNGNLTGKVGTALYVSPEMMDTSSKNQYNQKVDIYSLGIMFFEMCYRPLTTGMERVKILSNVRKESIELPEDFDEIERPKEVHIIRWLLNHNPSLRYTMPYTKY